eukprot:Partr_v1_DN24354_c0_g1_i3_m31819 putative N-acetyltransferase
MNALSFDTPIFFTPILDIYTDTMSKAILPPAEQLAYLSLNAAPPSQQSNNSQSSTTSASSIAQFDSSLLDSKILSGLPVGHVMRPLSLTDYHKGYFDLLAQLTKTGDVSFEEFKSQFEYMKAHSEEYHTIVIEDVANKVIVASGSIVVERKFIRSCGRVGHIEVVLGMTNLHQCAYLY